MQWFPVRHPDSQRKGTSAMTNDQEEDQEMALAQRQAHIRRHCLLTEQADEFTPPAFVKRVEEFMP